MIIYPVTTPSLSVNTYIVADLATQKAVVVDPVRDIEPILAMIKQEKCQVTHILETHVHADFVSGASELQQALGSGCQIVCSRMGGDAWVPSYAQLLVGDRDVIRIGNLRLEAWHTPGHSPEHLTWVVFDESQDAKVPCVALTGDFLFVGSVGRPDLLGPEQAKILAKQMYQSLFQVLPALPDHLQICPGHGAGSLCGNAVDTRTSSTLGYERQVNPYLRPQSEDTWTQHLLAGSLRTPAYFSRMKQINLQGPRMLQDLIPPTKMTLKQIAADRSQEVVICDLRMPESFAAHHLVGSINLPLRPQLAQWAADLLSPDTPLYLILPDERALAPALTALRLVGLDRCDGYACADEASLKAAGIPLASFSVIAPESVKQQCILDVRTPQERQGGYPLGSLSIELPMLAQQLDRVPKDQAVAVLCRSGFRASIAASMLARAGFHDVANIRGGVEAWKKAGLPLVT